MPATTYAEYYGAVFPAVDEVSDGVVYGPTGADLTGTLITSIVSSDVIAATSTINLADQSQRKFDWPAPSQTITGTIQWTGQASKPIVGAIAFDSTVEGEHFYSWAYNSEDRPSGPASGFVILTDGTLTRMVKLSFVGRADADTVTIFNLGVTAPFVIDQAADDFFGDLQLIGATDKNTDAGRLYGTIAYDATIVVSLYKSSDRAPEALVARVSSIDLPPDPADTWTLEAFNDSGLTGTFTVPDFAGFDRNFEIQGSIISLATDVVAARAAAEAVEAEISKVPRLASPIEGGDSYLRVNRSNSNETVREDLQAAP